MSPITEKFDFILMFIGTELGRRRPDGTIIYITDVAVLPRTKRSGIVALLLKVRRVMIIKFVFSLKIVIYIHTTITLIIRSCKLSS